MYFLNFVLQYFMFSSLQMDERHRPLCSVLSQALPCVLCSLHLSPLVTDLGVFLILLHLLAS